jgi:hypothetical protein
MMVVVTLLDFFEGRYILGGSRACGAAKDKLDVICSLALPRWQVSRLKSAVTGMEGEIVLESHASNRREVDPDLGLVMLVDRVCEVDFASALVDAVCLGRNFDGNTRSGISTEAPGLFVSSTRFDGKVVRV